MSGAMMQAQPQEEPKPEIAIADLELTYELIFSLGDFEQDKAIVENEVNILIQKITADLTRELGGQFSIGNVEFTKGSIKVSGTVLVAWLFITPIIQGYATNQLPAINTMWGQGSSPQESEESFNKVCKTVEKITTQTIEEHERNSNIKSKEYTITTKTIETVCEEWTSSQKP